MRVREAGQSVQVNNFKHTWYVARRHGLSHSHLKLKFVARMGQEVRVTIGGQHIELAVDDSGDPSAVSLGMSVCSINRRATGS
jgi:hypothetical protein